LQNVNFLLVADTTTTSIKENWKEIWNNPFKKQRLIIGTIVWLGVILLLPLFFSFIEKRKGVVLNDWVLAHIPAYNMSVLIFAIIWGMILLILIRAINNPSIYINYCWTFIFICIARIITISLVPLAPPNGFINLSDPLTGVFYGNLVITKDLFFSGHTSTLMLIFLCLERKTDKILALIAVFAVAILLLVQHVHYTIDILAAPIIVYSLYRVTIHFLYKKSKKKQEVLVSKVSA